MSGSGKHFCSGIDLHDFAAQFAQFKKSDPARTAKAVQALVTSYQASFTAIEKAAQPVIAMVHGACIGGGVDMISACDMRLCTADAVFQIKEVDIGIAADVGTLQRLPKIVGNQR